MMVMVTMITKRLTVLPEKLDDNLEAILEDIKPWSIPEKPKRCQKAQEFYEWIEENLSPEALGENIKLLTIRLAKAELSDRYQFFRRQVNKRCRNKMSNRGHECIFHVWDQAYTRLDEVEGRLPEPLSIPELQELKRLRERDDDRPFATLVALQDEEQDP
jgi:hypothetical protein